MSSFVKSILAVCLFCYDFVEKNINPILVFQNEYIYRVHESR